MWRPAHDRPGGGRVRDTSRGEIHYFRSVPPGVEHAAPVLPRDRPDLGLAETVFTQRVDQLRVAVRAPKRGGDRCAVEVRAERGMVDPDAVGDITNVLDDRSERRRLGVVFE